MVGRSGMEGERRAVVTAMPRSLPFLPYETAEGMVAKHADTSPPTSAIIDGPPPLYGTCTIFTPVRLLKYSPARCAADPLPDEEYASCPGRALASAVSSLTVLAGTDGCTTSM